MLSSARLPCTSFDDEIMKMAQNSNDNMEMLPEQVGLYEIPCYHY
jgi:hypothetical protein